VVNVSGRDIDRRRVACLEHASALSATTTPATSTRTRRSHGTTAGGRG
jgi:hypothetical protein